MITRDESRAEGVFAVRDTSAASWKIAAMKLWLAWLLVATACTTPNPRSCTDGLCTDQAFPFCDADGSLEGTPQTCVSVTCTPRQHAACRGDTALVCNGTGNDYDLVECPRGCDAQGCNECTARDQCPSGRPVCDTTGACRVCNLDDECASSVCEAGVCVGESGILYAASAGNSNSACLRSAPCTPARAFALARAAAIAPIVRMLPGVYAQGLVLDGPGAAPVSIVASGATVVAGDGLTLTNGASAQIRGLAITALSFAVMCDTRGQAKATLELKSVAITAGSTNANLFIIGNCTVTVDVADLDLVASTGTSIGVVTDGAFSGNRLRVHGQTSSAIAGIGNGLHIRITNSLLENLDTYLTTLGSSGPPSSLSFGYNTMVLKSGFTLDCSTGNFRNVTYDNNVVVGESVVDVASGAGCTVRNNVLFPQATTRAGNLNAPPLFVDSATGDYHLRVGSPAIDAAAPTTTFPSVQPDFDGTGRPQGPRSDIGAFERKP